MGFKMLSETILEFEATSGRAFEVQRLGFDRMYEGLQFSCKNQEVWSFYEGEMGV